MTGLIGEAQTPRAGDSDGASDGHQASICLFFIRASHVNLFAPSFERTPQCHPRAGRTYPLNKAAAARRLMSIFGARPSAEDAPALIAGVSAGLGDGFAGLLSD